MNAHATRGGGGHCALCFRLLSQRWTTCHPDLLRALVRADDAPFSDIVCRELDHLAPIVRIAPVCDYCASFVKDRTFASNGEVRRGRKHGMQLTIEHILTGGSMPAPSRPHFLRCLSALERTPPHPFREVSNLDDCILGRRCMQGYDCAVRWLFEGRQHILTDPILAKNLRRWISQHMKTETTDPCAHWALPPACRICGGASTEEKEQASYRNALSFAGSGNMEQALYEMESRPWITPGITLFCPRCACIATISFEYASSLRVHLRLRQIDDTPDAYYARLLARFHELERKKTAASSP